MGVEYIKHYNFRNIANGRVDFQNSSVVFEGENGQGKTNLLESIYFLCYGSSFRTRHLQSLVTLGKEYLSINGQVRNSSDGFPVNLSLNYKNKKKGIKIDGKSINDRKDIIRILPCILFGHGDIEYITGTQEKRRWFFDQTISLYNMEYINIFRKYKNILKIRNSLLKEKKRDLLEVYTYQLSTLGYKIQCERREALKMFSRIISDYFVKYSGYSVHLELLYKPSWKKIDNEEDIRKRLDSNLEKDLKMGMTTNGIHRDKYFYNFDNIDCTEISSTGQIRMLSLLLKMAQTCFFNNITGKKPLLLLDDVLLELDYKRRTNILNNLPDAEQIFFTFLPGEFKGMDQKDVLRYRVQEGKVFKNGK